MKKEISTYKFVIVLLIIIALIAGGVLGFKVWKDSNRLQQTSALPAEEEPIVVIEEPKKVQIYQGTERPIAVMIDNHGDARPQVGLNDAYIVYEIIVEGGFTRMMAVFKGVDLKEIGPVRSSRHYFLDYAMENDAIYAHFGWSPQAQSDITKYKVQNINGITQSSTSFWRTTGKYAPHNVLTSTKDILKIAENMGYSTTSSEKSVLNYVTDDVTLENGVSATEIYIPYSTSQKVSFTYNEETGKYVKYANSKKQTDWRSGEDIATKNIIITFAKNYPLNDGSGKDRQTLNNIGTLDGYYITNGKAIKIECIKESRTAKTVYKDLDGNEIKVNDGNTFIQICPLNADVKIEGEEEPETVSTSSLN